MQRKKMKKTAGPKDIAMLLTVDAVKNDFPQLDIIQLEETEVNLAEGAFHNGLSAVVRFTGRKRGRGPGEG